VTIRPATVTLFGGSQEQVLVEINPPLLSSTTAGATALTMRVVPQSDPDDISATETTLQIAPNYDRKVTMLQPAQRARRKATYEVMVDNSGNTHASCRMRLSDATGRVEADFNPPAIGVEPGGSTLVKMKLHSNRLQFERRSRTVQFTVEAEQAGAPSASAIGTFVQVPIVPERFFGRLLWLAALGAGLAGAWFGLIKPEIEQVARRESERAVASAPVPTTVPGEAAPSSTVVVPVPDQLPGVSERLEVQAASGETITASYTVPADQTLLLTDAILQNPYFDAGTAVLLRNNETLLEWVLDNVQIDQPGVLITPIEVPAGATLTLQVTCTAAGDPSLQQCQPGLLFSGRLRPTP
jgi:hypothetical protein